MKLRFLTILWMTIPLFSHGRSDSATITYSAYLETYYCYDFNEPVNHRRPDFIYSHNSHNEVNINLAYLKASYADSFSRANLAIMTGTYAGANLASEPGFARSIFEANAGVRLSKKHNLWVDAGIMPSHIGFESAIGKDCWNLTRSILADNSPYYEAGVKISYTSKNEHWYLAGLYLNGWQRIKRPAGNNTPCVGTQLTYKPNSKITLNISSFAGSDKADSSRQMRYFKNFYGIFQLSGRFSLIAGFDIGVEQRSKGSSKYNTWYSPVLIAKASLSSKSSLAARLEYYSDRKEVIIPTGTANGFETLGASLNFDYSIRQNILWRLEGRGFMSSDKVFTRHNDAVNDNYFISSALAVSF